MSLADALGPQLSQNVPFNDAYLNYEAEQPQPIDQDEEMDDLFDEDAVVDQVERYSIPPSVPGYTLFIEVAWELLQERVSIGWWAGRRDF